MAILRSAARRLSVLVVLGSLCVTPCRASAQERPLRNVLLNYSHEREMAMYAGFDSGLRSSLQSGFQPSIDFYAEYLDLIRFRDERHRQKTVDYLRVKCAGRRIDLIVVVGSLAFDFVRPHAGDLYPSVPIVFTSVNVARIEGLALGPNVTGVAVKREITSTLDLALRLQPDTVHVAVPVGTSAIERTWAAETRKTFALYERRVTITYFSDLERVKNLPPYTIILLSPLLYYDAAGRYRLPEETLQTISRDANAPVYGRMRSTWVAESSEAICTTWARRAWPQVESVNEFSTVRRPQASPFRRSIRIGTCSTRASSGAGASARIDCRQRASSPFRNRACGTNTSST
jgi:hypothetical protein